MSEIITLIIIILSLLTIFCLYKFLDKRGLYFALIIFNIISFVLSFKISVILKLNINTGIITLIETFTILYIFMIKYGDKELKNILKITFYANVMTALIIAIMNYFIPTITETISINMQGTFEYNYKILIIYPLVILLSEFIITKFYKIINLIQSNIPICIILTYIMTSLLYTIIFSVVSYLGILEIKNSLFVGISTYIIGIFITIINIIYIKLLTGKKVKKWEILF